MLIRFRHPSILLAFIFILFSCTEEPQNFEELALQSLAEIEGNFEIPGLESEVKILRDEWGIPHIYAENQRDLFFAQGFVQAQDRLWQMDMWRRVNEGRLSEILGSEAIEHDKLARLLQFRGPWEEEWTSYHPDGKMIFEAFSDGVNAYIEHIGDNLPVEYKLTGLEPIKWTPEASTGRVATALPLGAARGELNLARRIAEEGLEEVNRQEAPRHNNWIDLEIPEGVDYSIISEEVVEALGHFWQGFPEPPILPKYEEWKEALKTENTGAHETSPGSNNWAASGDLTESGYVLLANDPHRGVTNPSLRYLVHLDAPGYSVIGSTEPAIPGIAIGHNGRVAWGLTIVGTDQADVFIEELNPDNINEVRWQDEWYPLETVTDTIPVRDGDPVIVEHKFSRHGPVFYVDSTNHVAYSVKSTANEPGTGGYLGALRLAETDNCYEFLDELAWYKAPSENMVCGDADGNIAWLAAALTPSRSEGWYGRIPVPGTGGYEWEGFRSHTELPQEVNPERGWLGTANHDIQPEGYYPPIMFRPSPSLRWDRLRQMFDGVSNLTVEDYERMLHDTVYPWYEDELPLFRDWTSDDPDVERFRTELIEWNAVYHKESTLAAVHIGWRQNIGSDARDESVPIEEQREISKEALTTSVEDLRSRFGEDISEWRWGRLHESQFPHWLVSAYDLPPVERSGGSGLIAATGATFREIIDFSDLDNSRVTSTPGQSMQPKSPFYDNLLPLWGNEEFFPLLYTPDAVESGTVYRLVLTPE
ncbi:MAG: penicillin acylase family protein [Balneolaceae bacterium]|nr:penicillin acylase family protein [Balneolaceae bacterium]